MILWTYESSINNNAPYDILFYLVRTRARSSLSHPLTHSRSRLSRALSLSRYITHRVSYSNISWVYTEKYIPEYSAYWIVYYYITFIIIINIIITLSLVSISTNAQRAFLVYKRRVERFRWTESSARPRRSTKRARLTTIMVRKLQSFFQNKAKRSRNQACRTFCATTDYSICRYTSILLLTQIRIWECKFFEGKDLTCQKLKISSWDSVSYINYTKFRDSACARDVARCAPVRPLTRETESGRSELRYRSRKYDGKRTKASPLLPLSLFVNWRSRSPTRCGLALASWRTQIAGLFV